MREAAGSLRRSLISNCLESPFTRGGLTSNMETGLAGFATLCPPSRWIPAPRLHEDKLRGNDPPEADRGLGCPSGIKLPPKIEDPPQAEWGIKGG